VAEKDFAEFDMIIPMDASNEANLKMVDPTGSAKIELMRNYDPGYEGSDVPDPYYGGGQGFQNVFEILDRSTGKLLDKLESSN